MKRKLAVILASDVAGYSALVAADEEGTITRFRDVSALVHRLISTQSGRVFNTAGDAILAEFDSAVTAVRAAIDIQEALRTANAGLPQPQWLQMRIGVAVGDVIVVDNGDLLGDGVNIAARLQTLADAGGICISRDVQQLVQNKIGLGFDDLGPQTLKNIPQPVHAFRVTPHAGAAAGVPRGDARWTLSAARVGGIAAVLALIVAGLGWWWWSGAGRQAASDGRPGAFDAARIPLVTDEVRRRLVPGYAHLSGYKALAISNDGDFHGVAANAPDEAAAIATARDTCERDSTAKHKRPCFVYAAGNRVAVAPDKFPMPLAGEMAVTPVGMPFGRMDTPLDAMQQGRRLLAEYPAETRPKALAIGTRGEATWGAMSTGATEAEAVRRALEFCGFRSPGPCIVYAVGNALVAHPPQSRRVVGVLSFAGDKVIPTSERDRLMQVYAAGGWQALARGRNGSWHAVAGKPDEVSAVDAAMTACGAADRECRLYAVSRFLVAE